MPFVNRGTFVFCKYTERKSILQASQSAFSGKLHPYLSSFVGEKQVPLVSGGILESLSRTFKKIDDDQTLDLTVQSTNCLPPEHQAHFVVDSVAQLVEGQRHPSSPNRTL